MPSLSIWIYSLTSIIVVSLISLVGVFTLSLKYDKLKKVLIYLVSFAAGALLAGAFLHLLPELIEEHGFSLKISSLILGGIILFFILEKIISWHHYHMPMGEEHSHPVSSMILIGDGLHNFLDGLIIGASYLISIPAGIATTFAVALHEIPQEIGDFGVLLHGGFSKIKALLFNFLSALTAFLGLITALVLTDYIENIELFVVPLAIGGFIYIAGSDLIPELNKHPKLKSSILQLLTFLAGILIMAGLLFLE
ncbi:MAG: ZIP family metal transporter [Nanoarchaeota archaeon]|nr:ZIP family metal transporter [Nanoarchaeota archaeon]